MDEHAIAHFRQHRAELLKLHHELASDLSHVPDRKSHLDYVVGGALRRSFSITVAFFDLVENYNYPAAAPLARLQLDNTLRTTAAFLFQDTPAFLDHVAKGGRIDQLKDAQGKRFTDRSLVERLADRFPWVRSLYHDGSRFVHLSEVHMFHNNDPTIVLTERDNSFSDVAYLELVETFVIATTLFFAWVREWASVKKALQYLPEDRHFVGVAIDLEAKPVPRRRYSARAHKLANRFGAKSARASAIVRLRRRWRIGKRPTEERLDDLQTRLITILQQHGLMTCQLFNGWIVVDGRFPAIKTTLNPEHGGRDSVSVQLDVEVLVENRVICESFAGWGRTQALAAANAMDNFCANSLHVFLAALWNRPENEYVWIQKWQINGVEWKAVIGKFGVRFTNPLNVAVPVGLYESIRPLIERRALSSSVHWFRMFCANLEGKLEAVEALFDNQPWADAAEHLRTLPWKVVPGYYSVRCFGILVRTVPTD